MADMNELLSNITNAEINKQELERQLETLNKEYEMECKELQRLNDKNLQYKKALQDQERTKQIKDGRQQREENRIAMKNFVNELSDNFKR